MAFKVISEPKRPTSEDVARGEAYWQAQETIARGKLATADNGRSRRRYMDRISFCRVAAWQAETQRVVDAVERVDATLRGAS